MYSLNKVYDKLADTMRTNLTPKETETLREARRIEASKAQSPPFEILQKQLISAGINTKPEGMEQPGIKDETVESLSDITATTDRQAILARLAALQESNQQLMQCINIQKECIADLNKQIAELEMKIEARKNAP